MGPDRDSRFPGWPGAQRASTFRGVSRPRPTRLALNLACARRRWPSAAVPRTSGTRSAGQDRNDSRPRLGDPQRGTADPIGEARRAVRQSNARPIGARLLSAGDIDASDESGKLAEASASSATPHRQRRSHPERRRAVASRPGHFKFEGLAWHCCPLTSHAPHAGWITWCACPTSGSTS